MGLDQYLTVRLDIIDPKIHDAIQDSMSRLEGAIQGRVTGITSEVGYWRKANAIHKWFVETVQQGVDDCEEYPVTLEQLLTLRQLCQTVLADPSKAGKLLPCVEGFFFGSQTYDKYYVRDLASTVKIVDDLEQWLTDFRNAGFFKIFYQSSW